MIGVFIGRHVLVLVSIIFFFLLCWVFAWTLCCGMQASQVEVCVLSSLGA